LMPAAARTLRLDSEQSRSLELGSPAFARLEVNASATKLVGMSARYALNARIHRLSGDNADRIIAIMDGGREKRFSISNTEFRDVDQQYDLFHDAPAGIIFPYLATAVKNAGRSPPPTVRLDVVFYEETERVFLNFPIDIELALPLPPDPASNDAPYRRQATLSLVTLDTPARVSLPLTVRPWRPGDRFWPQGAPGPKKLQDFLVDAKIPRWLRPHIPLVAAAGEIVWVAGVRIADPVKLLPDSREVLEITVAPANPDTARVWEILKQVRKV